MLDISQIKQHILSSLNQDALEIIPHSVGGNNRIFSFSTDANDYIIKYYSPNQKDDRNRIGREWCFLEYLHSKSITCVPSPIVKNTNKSFSILSKIDGQSPTKETDRDHLVNVSVRFINMINTNLDPYLKGNVSHAFEHNLDISNTLLNVQKRFQHLRQFNSTTNSQLNDIITEAENKLAFKAAEIEATRGCDHDLTEVLSQSQLCLSPSDFGFHNLLLKEKDNPYFIDFEYAGWDDPAKLICDFILHPANQLSDLETKLFLQSIKLPMINLERCKYAYGLFALKWVAIILNIFLPEQLNRKQFSNPNLNVEAEKIYRLKTSKRMLKKIDINPFNN